MTSHVSVSQLTVQVLPGHNPNAVDYNKTTMAVTGRNPHQGGIYDNVVTHHVTLRNGTAKAPAQFGGGGSRSGIGLLGSHPDRARLTGRLAPFSTSCRRRRQVSYTAAPSIHNASGKGLPRRWAA